MSGTCSTSGESTEHGSPTEFLLLCPGSGTSDSSDDGRKEASEETENHLLFLRVHLLHGFLETVESESSTESTEVSSGFESPELFFLSCRPDDGADATKDSW